MTIKFECGKCGKCCRELGHLPLWEWEVEKLIRVAKKKNISLNIQPFKMMFDEKSELAFFIYYIIKLFF